MGKRKHRKMGAWRCAGAFSAWIIGSGFATGQETAQFFACYGRSGWHGVWAVGIGLLILGGAAVLAGYEHRENEKFDHFRYFCGPVLGTVYDLVTPAAVILMMPVLLSGGGTALYEGCGMERRLGTLCLAGLVLAAWRVGFERFTAAAAWTAPVVILFSLAVGAVTVVERGPSVPARAGAGWGKSAFLYLSMNAWGASAYHCNLGKQVRSSQAGLGGAFLGTAALTGAIALLCAALQGSPAMGLAVPTLYLAQRIHPLLGTCFFWVLLAGIFTSCSAMLWTVCPRKQGGRRAVLVMGTALLLGMFPFQKLVGSLYPLMGWIGAPYVLCLCGKMMIRIKKGAGFSQRRRKLNDCPAEVTDGSIS